MFDDCGKHTQGRKRRIKLGSEDGRGKGGGAAKGAGGWWCRACYRHLCGRRSQNSITTSQSPSSNTSDTVVSELLTEEAEARVRSGWKQLSVAGILSSRMTSRNCYRRVAQWVAAETLCTGLHTVIGKGGFLRRCQDSQVDEGKGRSNPSPDKNQTRCRILLSDFPCSRRGVTSLGSYNFHAY